MRPVSLGSGLLGLAVIVSTATAVPEMGRFRYGGRTFEVARQGAQFVVESAGAQRSPGSDNAAQPTRIASAKGFLLALRARLGLDLETESFELDSLSLGAPPLSYVSFYPTYRGAELLGGRADVWTDGSGQPTRAAVTLAARRPVRVASLSQADALAIARDAVPGTWTGRVLINRPLVDSLDVSGFHCYQRVVLGVERAGIGSTWIVYIDPASREVVSIQSGDKD